MNTLWGLMDQTLTLSRLGETVTTNNITNQNTPNFKPETVNFQSQLAQAWQDGSPVSHVTASMVTQPGSVTSDGNGVSMTQQMSELMQYQLLYNSASTFMTQESTAIKSVTEGQAL